jgi:hypothetical protein
MVTVDLDSLLGHPGTLGGEIGGPGPLDPEACRRLACDGAVTRVLVTRHPTQHQQHPTGHHDLEHGASAETSPTASDPSGVAGLGGRLQAAMALLPPIPGGVPAQPLDVGRTSRVIQPAQRTALAVRDGGCVFPGCSRPLAWCDAHHLRHWLHGGPTDLANLALVCRAHHRRPRGRLAAGPPTRRPPHRHPTASKTPGRRLTAGSYTNLRLAERPEPR